MAEKTFCDANVTKSGLPGLDLLRAIPPMCWPFITLGHKYNTVQRNSHYSGLARSHIL